MQGAYKSYMSIAVSVLTTSRVVRNEHFLPNDKCPVNNNF